ncbi:hypothetical protein EXM30_17090, partial [Clostridium botulinum]|nr:hypothetical protein [Clostridium botulinum]NFA33347.1 hypothetical protein [Clostridium botulinum]NFA58844.1 hypothetical protein [Clostridium botulinum]NFA72461.1 hypothetical protein [Clostridium botulinum]NFA92647.1 hypothetical protein [Clostridium botulinum]
MPSIFLYIKVSIFFFRPSYCTLGNKSFNCCSKSCILLDIPAIQNDYIEQIKFDKDIYITGLHFNQTGWKKDDRYS